MPLDHFDDSGTLAHSSTTDAVNNPTSLGFGPAWRRYIQVGVYNSDFSSLPPDPSSLIDNNANPLPYWNFVQSSGTSVTAQVVADATTASGHKITFFLAAGGAAGDKGYIEQIVPVAGARGDPPFIDYPVAMFVNTGAANLCEGFVEATQLLLDGVTVTGTVSTDSMTTTAMGASQNDIQPVTAGANSDGSISQTAYWLRIRVGIRRASGATTDAAQVDVFDVRIETAWDTKRKALFRRDAFGTTGRLKGLTPIGWVPFAFPWGVNNTSTFGNTITLPINGGAVALPFFLTAPMLLQGYKIGQKDAAGAHTLEARLYEDRLNFSSAANFVAGSDATWSFTPGGASVVASGNVSGAPVSLPSGLFWLVIRNTSASVTAGIGSTADSTYSLQNYAQTQTLAAALGSTLDLVSGWSKTGNIPAAVVNGRVFGQASSF